MKKLMLLILIGLLFQTASYSQSLYEKKGLWGVTYGASINYPTEKSYYTGTLYLNPSYGSSISQKLFHVQLNNSIGQYAEISRMFKLAKINETNFLFIEPALSYHQINYSYSYDELNDYNEIINTAHINIRNQGVLLSFKLKHILSFEKKSVIFALNSELGFFNDAFTFFSNKKEYNQSFACGFSLGYSFHLNNIIVSPIIQYEIFYKRKQQDLDFILDYKYGHPDNEYYKHYDNIRLGVMVNF